MHTLHTCFSEGIALELCRSCYATAATKTCGRLKIQGSRVIPGPQTVLSWAHRVHHMLFPCGPDAPMMAADKGPAPVGQDWSRPVILLMFSTELLKHPIFFFPAESMEFLGTLNDGIYPYFSFPIIFPYLWRVLLQDLMRVRCSEVLFINWRIWDP